MRHEFIQRSRIPAPAEAVFAWHEAPDAFARLNPPWEKVTILEQTGPVSEAGSRVTIEITLFGPIRQRWVSVHQNYIAGRQFQDVQVSGPFQFWEHTHSVIPQEDGSCVLQDRIVYELPLSPLSDWVAGWHVRGKLARMFEYRHQVVFKQFAAGV